MPSTADDSTTSDPQTFWLNFVLPRLVQIEGVSPRDKNGAVVRARQALDAELSAMHLAMCSIRTRCNALAPISVLPAEALARIFQLCAAVYPPALRKRHPLGWIEVTHVCRHWRDTAMQFPNLWVDVPYKLSSKWGETMLKRAKAAPISLRRDITGAEQSNLNCICEHFSRMRELRLVGPPANLKLTIDALPPPPTILETLEAGPADIKAFKGPSFELAGAIAASRLPSLRRLALRALWVPWSAPILSGLKYLELQLYHQHTLSAGGYPSTSWEALFDALRNMPDLESLILKDCYPSGLCKDAGHVILQLPRLKVLQLRGLSIPCFGIAARLQIPPFCQVQLRCRDAAEPAGVAEILPFLTTHFHDGVDLPPWHTLSITRQRNRFRLEMWRSSDDLNEEEDYYKPKTTADFAIWYHSPQLFTVFDSLKALSQTLPLHTLLTLCIRVDRNISEGNWVDLLGRCTSIQDASVIGPWGTSFCTALGMTMDNAPAASSANGVHEALFLESLKYLRLSGTDFRNNWPWQYKDWLDGDVDLIEWLTERKRVDADSEFEIDLRGCSIRHEWVQNLRTEARRVKWDGDEGMVEDESEESDEESDSSSDG